MTVLADGPRSEKRLSKTRQDQLSCLVSAVCVSQFQKAVIRRKPHPRYQDQCDQKKPNGIADY